MSIGIWYKTNVGLYFCLKGMLIIVRFIANTFEISIKWYTRVFQVITNRCLIHSWNINNPINFKCQWDISRFDFLPYLDHKSLKNHHFINQNAKSFTIHVALLIISLITMKNNYWKFNHNYKILKKYKIK